MIANASGTASHPMTNQAWPIYYAWNGDVMVPLPRFKHRCDQQFTVDKVYRLVEEAERSWASHDHFFAVLTEGWRNLPEDLSSRFPTVESLRKWSLIKSGYADVNTSVYETASDAKMAAMTCGRYTTKHAIIIVKGRVVTVYTAKSQSVRAMDKATFQASKTAVLDIVASMIGVTTEALSKQIPVQEVKTNGQKRQLGRIADKPDAVTKGAAEAPTDHDPITGEVLPQSAGASNAPLCHPDALWVAKDTGGFSMAVCSICGRYQEPGYNIRNKIVQDVETKQ
jgi:hypothetical protein